MKCVPLKPLVNQCLFPSCCSTTMLCSKIHEQKQLKKKTVLLFQLHLLIQWSLWSDRICRWFLDDNCVWKRTVVKTAWWKSSTLSALSVTDIQRCTNGLFKNHSTHRSGTKRKSVFFLWFGWCDDLDKKRKEKGENVLFSAMKCVIMSHTLVITRVKFHLLCSFNPALCTSSTVRYMVILWLYAGKQRRAVLSGAQNSICISLYEREVWKSNSSASEDVYVSVCAHAKMHLAHITWHVSAVCGC